MTKLSTESKSALVLELAEEFLARRRAGERPTVGEYAARHPELASEIREVFPAMAMLENVAVADESLGGAPTGEHRPSTLPPLERLGDFRILREIGHGGMGVVYEAEQVSLGRHVALKVLPASMLRDEKHRRRFEREAKAAAKLHHTNIVPVFGVGEHEGTPFYAMQFIQGSGLDSVLEELKRLRTGEKPREAAGSLTRSDARPPGHTAADAARSLMTGRLETVVAGEPDLEATVAATPAPGSKPEPPRRSEVRPADSGSVSSSSVSILAPGTSEDRNSRVRRSNFWRAVARIGVQVAEALDYAHRQGVVHRDVKPSNLLLDARGIVWVADFGLAKADDQQNLTHTGDILGTLRYMPPEAFEGKADKLGDVYSLGLTLYEMLAFRPAFEEKDRGRLIRQVTGEPPPPLRKLNPDVPRDLETIVHKAIDRDPSHRYATSGELAEDLRRFVEDEPIRARRLMFWERGVKWARRRPVIAGLVALVNLLMAVALGVFVWSYFKINESLADARSARDLAQHLAKTERLASDEARAQTKVASERAEDLAWQDYVNRVNRAIVEVDRDNVALAEDLLHGCPPEKRGWEWHYVKRRCHSERLDIEPASTVVNTVAFSPDGLWIASGNGRSIIGGIGAGKSEEAVEIRERSTGRLSSRWPAESRTITAIRFSPDGQRVAISGSNPHVEVRDARTGDVVWSKFDSTVNPAMAMSLAFAPDGGSLAVGYGTYSTKGAYPVKLYGAEKGEERLAFPGRVGGTHDLAFHPDGKRVAAAAFGVVEVWDVAERKRVQELVGHAKWIYGLDYSRDGLWLASGGWDGTIKLRDAATGEERANLFGHEGFVTDLAFSPDGRALASTSEDRGVRLWEIPGGRHLGTLHGHTDFTMSVAWSPDGRELATGGVDGALKVWDRRDGLPIVFRDHSDTIHWIQFDGEGRSVLSKETTQGRTTRADYRVWVAATGEPDAELALLDLEAIQKRIEPTTERPRAFRTGYGQIFTADGSRIARLLHGKDAPGFSLAGRSKTHLNSVVEIVNATDGRVLWTLKGHTADVVWFAFSPDGRRLATASFDRTIKLWDVATGREVFTLRGHAAGVTCLDFSPDGKRLVSGGFDNTARVWDATPLLADVLSRHEARHRDKGREVVEVADRGSEEARGHTMMQIGDFAAASAAFERAVERSPDDPRLRMFLVLASHRAGDKEVARRQADALYERLGAPKDKSQASMASLAFSIADQPKRAAAVWARYIEREPEDVDAYRRQATELRQADDREGVERIADLAHSRFGHRPPKAEFAYALASIYAEAGRWDLAAERLRKTIESNPDSFGFERCLHLTHLAAGATEKARPVLDAMSKRLDEERSKDLLKLHGLLRQSLLIPPPRPESVLSLAMTTQELAKSVPQFDALSGVGAAQYRAGRLEEAVRLIEESRRKYTGRPMPEDGAYLAMALHRLGRRDEATKHIAAVKAEVPKGLDVWETITKRILVAEAEGVLRGPSDTKEPKPARP